MDLLPQWINLHSLELKAREIQSWLFADVLVPSTLVQLLAIVSAFIIARLAAPRLRGFVESRARRYPVEPRLKQVLKTLASLMLPVIWLFLQWLSIHIAAEAGWPNQLIRVTVSLLTAWVIIRFTSAFVRDPVWSRIVAIAAWAVAALNILNLLDDAIALLESLALTIGGLRISALLVIKAVVSLIVLIWLATWVSGLVERRVQRLPRLTPSIQLLFGKLFKIILFTIAIVVALSNVGIDLTAFAVFTGAVGVGVGFGLQAVISNFVAGLIILLDRSLKVGDFVDLESGVTGEVREINVRSTVITTNDNIDILVPNAEFVSGRVTNWTYRDAYRRLRVPFGVAYGTDKELVRKAGLEAAEAVPFTLTGDQRRAPQVWLVGFGDSSLNFELVVWLAPEVVNRPGTVNAAYCWAIATALGNYGIEIPFPQRDLHIKGAVPVQVSGEQVQRDVAN